MSTVQLVPGPITLLQSTTSIYSIPHLNLKAVKSNHFASNAVPPKPDPMPITPTTIPSQSTVSTPNQHISDGEPQQHAHVTFLNNQSVPVSPVSDSEMYDIDSPSTDITDSELDDVPISQLFLQLTECQEDVLFAERGYKKIKILKNIEQGQLILASMNKNNKQISVIIKKCDKFLLRERISHCNEDEDLKLCVDNDIVKEKLILKYLNVDNKPKYIDSIVQYIDHFESETDFYLVTECLNDEITLAEFISKAHHYININKLSKKEYQKIVKCLAWKLFCIVNWLHNTMSCCHLGLNLQTIHVINCDFFETSNGYYRINPSINIKLNDFSKSEVFDTSLNNNFDCKKHSLLRTHIGAQYISPKLYEEGIFDARSQDIWSLGMILFHITTGEPLYDTIDPFNAKKPLKGDGHWAVMTSNIESYILMHNLSKYMHVKMLSVIDCLLKYDESKRMNISQILKHKWFNSYYNRQKLYIEKQQKIMKPNISFFPYYICEQ